MSDLRRCPSCDRHLNLVQFGYRDAAHTRLQSYCRVCANDAWRAWYQVEANGAHHKSLVRARRRRRIDRHRRLIHQAKSKPCADCGNSYPPYVMDFDHVGHKTEDVSKLVYSLSTKRLLDEMARCQVVCANCHRLRTQQRHAEKRTPTG